jgi:hypothetical protein
MYYWPMRLIQVVKRFDLDLMPSTILIIANIHCEYGADTRWSRIMILLIYIYQLFADLLHCSMYYRLVRQHVMALDIEY